MNMAKKKITKASKRRLVFFGTISVGIIAYFAISLAYYTVNIYQLKQEEKELTENLNVLKSDEKSLKTEIEKLKDPEYLARYARENFLYSKNGEIVIQLQSESENTNTQMEEQNYFPVIFIGSIILLLVIGYTIKKGKTK